MSKRRCRPVAWPPVECAVCDLLVRRPEEAALVGGEGSGEFVVVHRQLCLDVVRAHFELEHGELGVQRFEPMADFLRRIEGEVG